MPLIVEGIMGGMRRHVHRYAKADNVDDECVDKEEKGTINYVIKQEIKFKDYKECLKNNKTILKSQQRSRSRTHNVFTKKVKKIAFSANDDKRE